jgi:hypothetical protein
VISEAIFLIILSLQQFNNVWQQKRRTLVATNNNGAVSSLGSISNSNSSSSTSNTQPVNSLDNGDKNRASVCVVYRNCLIDFV